MDQLSPLAWLAITTVVYLVTCAAFGWRVAEQKSRPVEEGILFGLILGPIGLLILVLLPNGPALVAARAQVERGHAVLVEADDQVERGMVPIELASIGREPAKVAFPAVDLVGGKPAARRKPLGPRPAGGAQASQTER